MAVTDYSTTPSANTLISGINIGEGCPPANINDAIRQMMADLAASPASKIIGTDIQAYNAKLAALAALTLAADKLIYATGANTLAAADLTSFARTLLAEVDAAGMRGELGLLGLATKNQISVPADIDATGTADATTRLAGDGTWKPVPSWERVASVAVNGSGAVLVTGLDSAKSYILSMPRGRASTSVSVRARFSNDGGSTFGPYITVINSANWNTSMFFSSIELTPTDVGVAWQLLSFSLTAAGYERIYPRGIHYDPGTSTLLCPVDYDSVEFSTSSGTFVDPAAGPAGAIEVFERG